MSDDLQKAAQAAIEKVCSAKLCEFNSMSSRQERLRLMDEAVNILREGLKAAEAAPPKSAPEEFAFLDCRAETIKVVGKKHLAMMFGTQSANIPTGALLRVEERIGDSVTLKRVRGEPTAPEDTTDWEAVASDQAMTIAMLQTEIAAWAEQDQLRDAAKMIAAPVAWRWLVDGKPEVNDAKGSTCWPMPGPDADIIALAAQREFPVTVQFLWDGPPDARVDVNGLTREDICRMARESDLIDPDLGDWMTDYGYSEGSIRRFAVLVAEAVLKERNP